MNDNKARVLADLETYYELSRMQEHYSSKLDDSGIAGACSELQTLVGSPDFLNKSFLNVDSRSGFHRLAPTQLGTFHVTAVDIDDWLDDYSYESAAADGNVQFILPLEFALGHAVVAKAWFGLFGVGYSEFRPCGIKQ